MAPCHPPKNSEHSVGRAMHPLPYAVVFSSTKQCKEGPTGILLSHLSVFACVPPSARITLDFPLHKAHPSSSAPFPPPNRV